MTCHGSVMERLTLTLYGAKQGHQLLSEKIWPFCKSLLAHGNVVITARKATRSTEQNDRMWAMLTDFSEQYVHCGMKFSKEDWKVIFCYSLWKDRRRFAPGLYEGDLVPLSTSTSDLTIAEMSELMEFIAAEGAERGVVFGDES